MDIVEQTDTIPVPADSFSLSFVWTAPTTLSSDTISFWAAANYVNGNGSADRGDLWNTGQSIVASWVPLGMASLSQHSAISVFPNPVSDMLNVMVNEAKGDFAISVYDLAGNTLSVCKTSAGSLTTLNTTDWANGIYYISVSQNNQVIKVLPVVKQ